MTAEQSTAEQRAVEAIVEARRNARTMPERDAPYRSVRHALASAFAFESHGICSSPALFARRSMPWVSQNRQERMTPWDRAAQSAIVIRLLHENCREHVIAAATAQFMPGEVTNPRGVLLSKAQGIDTCARHVQSYPHLSGYPDDYLRDVVCLWADELPSMSEPEWMAELGKSSRMLRNIKFGNSQRGTPGVCQLLDDLLDEGAQVLGEVFSSRGLI